MPKINSSLLVAASLFAATSASHALSFQFQDIDDIAKPGTKQTGGSGFLVDKTHSYTGVFDIVAGDGDHVNIKAPYSLASYSDLAGFNPAKMFATKAIATFWFQDDQPDTVDKNGKITKVGDAPESVTIALDGAAFTTAYSVKKVSVFGHDVDILTSLNTDGKLVYAVSAVTGDFIFDYANLYVEATMMPDAGSSCLMLGLGLVGLAGLRRKKA